MNPLQSNINSIPSALYASGLRHAVICPGSRNAPLVMAFSRFGKIQCHSVTDERSAGFQALGMAKMLKQPVAVICTSGSALANIYPAVLEAFYMQVPILLISADRPAELIDRWDGQTIHQSGLFGRHIIAEYELPQNYDERSIEDVYSLSKLAYASCINAVPGPVHLNVPLKEPLYLAAESEFEYPEFKTEVNLLTKNFEHPKLPDLKDYKKKLLLIGASDSTVEVSNELADLSDLLVLTDVVSNSRQSCNMPYWESIVLKANEKAVEELMPDLLITTGKMILSKQLRQLLRKYKPQLHIHSDENGFALDPFFTQPIVTRLSVNEILSLLGGVKDSSYRNQWALIQEQVKVADDLQMQTFNEMSAIKTILEHLTDKHVVHVANSMSIRNVAYNAMHLKSSVELYSNRGVSGIDGCSSTAIGAATVDSREHVLITGDIAFLYDINAFLRQNLPQNLSVFVMNNQGGGIFKIIEGPSKMREVDPYLSTPQHYDLKHVAALFQLDYYMISNFEDLEKLLKKDVKGPFICDVKTDMDINNKNFNQYKEKLS
ncbi:MAG TPA: 2-succinyl-5-enolpyruvyl-6-hydroxy-3-cyclohexene-1-carboxylic-acid synthase [Bacteroidia bacterium]